MKPPPIAVSDVVAAALAEGRPVVALESTIISHGLPRPRNLAAARHFESLLLGEGVTPATIAVLDGVAHVGLDDAQLARIAEDPTVTKLSARDLAPAMVKRATGATTVAATALLAHRAGIRVFSTGGLGGVHRGAAQSFDESADLVALAGLPITVVSAGAKSVLDVPATLERIETLSITVLGYRTNRYPGFYLADSGLGVDWRVETPAEVAEVMVAQDALDLHRAILVANPLPAEKQLDPALHDRVLADALTRAEVEEIKGKDTTPFLLAYFQEHTAGASLEVNIELASSNTVLGGQIARAWADRGAPVV
jgi:pseudouridine-5'-phosphate glycosidase